MTAIGTFSSNGSVVTWTVASNCLSPDALYTHINAFYTDISAVLLSRRISYTSYPITKLARGPERTVRIFVVGGSRVLIKGVRASGGISLLAGRGVVAFRRECTGMNGRGGGSPFDVGTRGEFRGRGRNARIECVCALRVHAVLRCARLETRTRYIYGSRSPGR